MFGFCAVTVNDDHTKSRSKSLGAKLNPMPNYNNFSHCNNYEAEILSTFLISTWGVFGK